MRDHVESDLTALDLKRALTLPGCPLCRLRSEAELRYIHSLLWEHANDPDTRTNIIASLGYCPTHTWQAGLTEAEKFGVPLGNVIIYRHLTDVITTRLTQYARRIEPAAQPAWKRWLHKVLPQRPPSLSPDELKPVTACRICQIGERTARTDIHWLLRGLSQPQHEFCTLYEGSDGLCLQHLRQALEQAMGKEQEGVKLLVESTLQRLGLLQRDLAEFDRKNTWEYRAEKQTDDEQNAWLRALTFFGGNH
jgi:hypothetical protein